jgi:hypothetical protein
MLPMRMVLVPAHGRNESQEGTRWESGTAPQRYTGTIAVIEHWAHQGLGSDGQ